MPFAEAFAKTLTLCSKRPSSSLSLMTTISSDTHTNTITVNNNNEENMPGNIRVPLLQSISKSCLEVSIVRAAISFFQSTFNIFFLGVE